MKLRNKKTGEITEVEIPIIKERNVNCGDGILADINYNSLSELSEEWEDYEEPKEDCITSLLEWISDAGPILHNDKAAEAVEKLKAWKRLKDKGFKFEGIKEDYTRILQSQEPFRTGKRYLQFNKSEDEEWMEENWKDLNLLFGGEE